MSTTAVNETDVIEGLKYLSGKSPTALVTFLINNKDTFKNKKVKYKESGPYFSDTGNLLDIYEEGSMVSFVWDNGEETFVMPKFSITDLDCRVSSESVLLRIKGVGSFAGEFKIYF